MTLPANPPDSVEPLPPSVPRSGELIGGKYIVERVMGTGGMGAVLEARHEQLGQRVAIKVLLPDALRDPLATERFLREAKAAIAIRSEHVARVMDFGTLESGSPYLVMEHLDGHDLKAELASKGMLAVSDVVDYVIQACEALCEAHRRGIVHRDLKPANIFLTSRMDGSPHIKVLDFGISKTVSVATADSGSGKGITKTDAVFGTPAYMSPEQLRSSKFVDHRTDIWAMGVVLYELLTAKLPFGAWTDGVVAMCAHILEDPPVSMRSLRPDVPEALEAAVLRCMAKNPSERFQGISDLTDAIVPFASPSSHEIAARIARISSDSLPFEATVKSDSGAITGPRPPHTSSAWGRTGGTTRRRSFAMISIGMVVVGFAIGGAWMLGSRSARNSAPSAAPSLGQSDPWVEPTPSAAASSPAPVVQPVASVAPSAAPAVTAAPTAPPRTTAVAAPKPEASKSAAPAATQPACPPGQNMSNGHCCRAGFEWKGGECVPGVAKGF